MIAHYESSEGHARCLLSLVKRWHGEATELTNRLEKALGTNPTHADPPMVLRLSARLRALRSLGVHASAVLHRSTLLEASMPVLDDDDGITTLRQRVVSVRSEVQSLTHGLLELAAHASILDLREAARLNIIKQHILNQRRWWCCLRWRRSWILEPCDATLPSKRILRPGCGGLGRYYIVDGE